MFVTTLPSTVFALFVLALLPSVTAGPVPLAHTRTQLSRRLSPDPAGERHVGNGQGEQFITGQCLSDADCASGCCAVLGDIGICSGPQASLQQGKQGCGFGGNGADSASSQGQDATFIGGGSVPSSSTQGQDAIPVSSSSISSSTNTGSGLQPDPAGVPNIGNGNGGQFITGQCLSDDDCASGCCAVLGDIGICSGPAVSFAQGKQGCGFGGSSTQRQAAAVATPAASNASGTGSGSGLKPDPAGVPNVGNGQGGQFITGQCLSDADCASGCCAVLGDIGICSGPAVSFAQGKQGCGFGDSSTQRQPAAAATPAASTASGTSSSSSSSGSGLKPDPAGVPNIGNGQGGQFITGQCLSDADCASGCCAVLGDIGICSGPAVSFAQGKQGCGFVGSSNGDAENDGDCDDEEMDVVERAIEETDARLARARLARRSTLAASRDGRRFLKVVGRL